MEQNEIERKIRRLMPSGIAKMSDKQLKELLKESEKQISSTMREIKEEGLSQFVPKEAVPVKTGANPTRKTMESKIAEHKAFYQ